MDAKQPTELEALRAVNRVEEALAVQRARQQEAIHLFEPTAIQQPIVDCGARTWVVSGGNRSSKTLICCYIISCWLLGKRTHASLPATDGRAYFVGANETHLGEVMYRKIFRPGAFKTIRDLKTGLLRAYRPWEPEDAARHSEVRWSEPLIPERFIKSVSYRLKKDNIPRMVKLNNGWEIIFLTGEGIPAQGFDANLCLAGWSLVYDPVRGEHRRVDSVDGPWHVEAIDPENGSRTTKQAQRPFIRGYGDIYRYTLSSGHVAYATSDHRVMSSAAGYVSLSRAFAARIPLRSHCVASQAGQAVVSSDPCLSPDAEVRPLATQVLQSVGQSRWLAPDEPETVQRGPEFHAQLAASVPTQGTFHMPWRSLSRSCEHTSSIAGPWSFPAVPWPTNSEDCVDEYVRLDSGLAGSMDDYWPYFHLCDARPLSEEYADQGVLRRSSGAGEHIRWHSQMGGTGDTESSSHTDRGYRCVLRRSDQSEPGHVAELLGQTRQLPDERDSQRHGASLRSRGTTFRHGTSQPPRVDRKIALVDLSGETICRSSDASQSVTVEKMEWVCRDFVWDFGVDDYHNYLSSSLQSHNCYFDEEISNSSWYIEAMRGLIDRKGVFIWSATPQAATEQFLRLMERAEDNETGRLARFVLPTTTNPHLSNEEIEEFAANLTDEQIQVHIQGEPAVASFLMFPTFDMEVLGFDRDRLYGRQVPDDWTRYMYVDPGYGVTYCLFVAVPPPKHPAGDIWLAYDELYISKCTAHVFGERVSNKIGSQYFQAYVLDEKHGRKTETSGKTNMQQLSDALRERRCGCVETQYGFIPGYIDRLSGWSLLRDTMRVRPGLGTKLRILRDSCPNLERTMRRLLRHRKRAGTGWVYEDDVAPGQDDHPCDALRYLAGHAPIWVTPEVKPPAKSWAVLRYEEKRRRNQPEHSSVILGPAQYFSDN